MWNWTHDEPAASEIYTDDALLEFPQSGEKFRGKENFITWRSAHPAQAIEFELRSIRGEGDTWVAEGKLEVDGGAPMPFVEILHFSGNLVDRETIYMGEPFPPSEARARTPSTLSSSQRRGFLCESRRQVVTGSRPQQLSCGRGAWRGAA